jgi:hypothetical protein
MKKAVGRMSITLFSSLSLFSSLPQASSLLFRISSLSILSSPLYPKPLLSILFIYIFFSCLCFINKMVCFSRTRLVTHSNLLDFFGSLEQATIVIGQFVGLSFAAVQTYKAHHLLRLVQIPKDSKIPKDLERREYHWYRAGVFIHQLKAAEYWIKRFRVSAFAGIVAPFFYMSYVASQKRWRKKYPGDTK